jgi:hypothetical protein
MSPSFICLIASVVKRDPVANRHYLELVGNPALDDLFGSSARMPNIANNRASCPWLEAQSPRGRALDPPFVTAW